MLYLSHHHHENEMSHSPFVFVHAHNICPVRNLMASKILILLEPPPNMEGRMIKSLNITDI